MKLRGLWGYSALISLLGAGIAQATVLDTAALHAANKLVTSQDGVTGGWSAEPDAGGQIVDGLVAAGGLYNVPAYKTAAVNGANYILNHEQNFYGAGTYGFTGEEVYALTRVTQQSGNATYSNAASSYFSFTIPSLGGTSSFIQNHLIIPDHNIDPPNTNNEESLALIHMAYYTKAAYAVNSADKATWRSSLINTLGMIDDNDYVPVGSLGAAIWALADTGSGLDNTTVPGSGTVSGLTLSQLPGRLAQEVVPSGPYVNAFYLNYEHLSDGLTDAGYTEDTALEIMGLQAAVDTGNYNSLAGLLGSARNALAGAVETDGTTHADVAQLITDPGFPPTLQYGGRLLEAVPEPSSCLILLAGSGLMTLRRRRVA